MLRNLPFDFTNQREVYCASNWAGVIGVKGRFSKIRQIIYFEDEYYDTNYDTSDYYTIITTIIN